MKNLMKKLKKNTGETLVETLVALLISVLSLALLASMIVSGNNITSKSSEKMNAYYLQNNDLSASSGTSTAGTVYIQQKVGDSLSEFCLVPGKTSYSVKCYVNNSFPGDPVVSYKVSD